MFLSFLQTADCVGGHNHKPTSHRTSPAEFIGFADGINSSPLIYLRAATRIPAVTIACASRTAFHMNFAVLIIFSQYLAAGLSLEFPRVTAVCRLDSQQRLQPACLHTALVEPANCCDARKFQAQPGFRKQLLLLSLQSCTKFLFCSVIGRQGNY